MSYKKLEIELKPSKCYLILSASVYSICLLAFWLRVDYILINSVATILIIISFINLLQKDILMLRKNSIKNITIVKDSASFTTTNNSTYIDDKYKITYQSNFLIIIRIQKKYIAIFKDAVVRPNISSINQFINIDTK